MSTMPSSVASVRPLAGQVVPYRRKLDAGEIVNCNQAACQRTRTAQLTNPVYGAALPGRCQCAHNGPGETAGAVRLTLPVPGPSVGAITLAWRVIRWRPSPSRP